MRHLRSQDQVVAVYRPINAVYAMAMVIGRINAHPEEEHEDDKEDDADAMDEEDVMLDEEAVSRHLVLWLSRGQKHLGVCCNKPPIFPQGPMAVT